VRTDHGEGMMSDKGDAIVITPEQWDGGNMDCTECGGALDHHALGGAVCIHCGQRYTIQWVGEEA
jgi:hypothetical protein